MNTDNLRKLAFETNDGVLRGPAFDAADGIDRLRAEIEAGAPGEEEGATCNRDGCGGTMIVPEVEGCYCHISPPCGACVNNPLTCDECWAEME